MLPGLIVSNGFSVSSRARRAAVKNWRANLIVLAEVASA